jgi:hypothetical protein
LPQTDPELALADDDERAAQIGGGRLYNHTLKIIPAGKWASDAQNRKRVWNKLVEMVSM